MHGVSGNVAIPGMTTLKIALHHYTYFCKDIADISYNIYLSNSKHRSGNLELHRLNPKLNELLSSFQHAFRFHKPTSGKEAETLEVQDQTNYVFFRMIR